MMFFNVEGHEVKVEVEKKYRFKSKHSENTVEKLKIHFQVYNHAKIPKTIFSVEDGREWKIINSSYYYTEGNPVVRYIFDIEEIEDLNIKSLLLNSLKFYPYEYMEEVDEKKGDALVIKAQIEMDLESWKQLETLYRENIYVSVKRHGISPQKKKMRFGKVIWSHYGEDKIKCAISLYEEVLDEFKPLVSLKPEIDNLEKTASLNSELLEVLLDILKEKNILNEKDLEKIIMIHTKNSKNIKTLKFGEVEDLEKFLEIYNL